MRGVTGCRRTTAGIKISPHTPHAGRDCPGSAAPYRKIISTHTPHAGRDWDAKNRFGLPDISTHTPHAGRDHGISNLLLLRRISTHTPHAGRDLAREAGHRAYIFLLTRPMWGVTGCR